MAKDRRTISAQGDRLGYYCGDTASAAEPDSTRSLAGCSIIPAVGDIDSFNTALASPPRAVSVLIGNPLTLPKLAKQIHDVGKLCLVNVDFVDGLSRDRFAAEYLAEQGVDGLVSTRFEILKAASTFGMLTVLRTFAIDTAAVSATRKSLTQFKPDAVEILPAVAAPRVVKRLKAELDGIRLIAGGLIEGVKEIEALLDAGLDSVTTSDHRLWLI